MEITVTARAKAKPGKEAELEQALRLVVGPTHAEKGCLRYMIHRGVQDPSSFLIEERWSSPESAQSHLATSHIQNLFQKVPGLVEGSPEILSFELLPEGDKIKGTF